MRADLTLAGNGPLTRFLLPHGSTVIIAVSYGHRHIVVFANPLQYQERRRAVANIPNEMRSTGLYSIRIARTKVCRLIRTLNMNSNTTGEYIERILNVVMIVPGDDLRRRDLQFTDTEALAFGMSRATFYRIEITRIRK